jgi:aspartyl-tRNA(Asn)/glutamyl-tRNA(Gln) amidotransferase subunit C
MTDDEIRALAHLARLELSPDEVKTIGPQLQTILGFVEQLSKLNTEDVEPMTTALDVVNRWQGDSNVRCLDREEALQNSPSHDGEYFLVPAVLGSANS